MNALWSARATDLLHDLDASATGLTPADALRRLQEQGPNTPGRRTHGDVAALFFRQFTSPIVLLLLAAALLSFLLHDSVDGGIVIAIVAVSGLLGFWQERGAAGIVAKLLAIVDPRAVVLRDGIETSVPADQVVAGDVVVLSAGSSIPADCRLLDARDLFLNEAALTGETYPVEKAAGELPADTPLSKRTNVLFMGTHVVSGCGHAVVVRTGGATEFGHISERLRLRAAETEFERGVRRFGVFLMEVTLLLVLTIFAINVYLAKPILDSFLFALALAVGLSPQLLPAIISVNLAKGAKAMAGKHVIVKRLTSIENFGSMDVLCCDKTGTLTQGVVHVHSAVDASGAENDDVLFHAYLNASFQTGFANPIDTAIRNSCSYDVAGWERLDEVPYDFVRKRLSVLISHAGSTSIVTKGSVESVLSICTAAATNGRPGVRIEKAVAAIRSHYSTLSSQGFRTIAVAVRNMAGARAIRREDEHDLTFLGLIVLHDPLKPDVGRTITALNRLGIALKIVTGDNVLVATQVARSVGLDGALILTGSDLRAMSDEALPARATEAGVFAEIEPNQKERIIRALRKAGHVTGFIGDGINDGPALRAADVGISVQQAVDVAKAAADIVLLQQDLSVLEDGVREGRKTFANTLKYVFMATSANFGNMFSMAGASLFLPFLPLLPKQILLTNLLTDFPELSIATDRVDDEWIARPHRWDIRFIREFMLVFGALSSLFDYLTFAVLVWWLHAGPAEFRTGWFLESVISAALVVLVVRTRGRALDSPPSPVLLGATLLVVVGALALPFVTFGRVFGFVVVPPAFIGPMGGIIVLYILSAELVKRWFYRRIATDGAGYESRSSMSGGI